VSTESSVSSVHILVENPLIYSDIQRPTHGQRVRLADRGRISGAPRIDASREWRRRSTSCWRTAPIHDRPRFEQHWPHRTHGKRHRRWSLGDPFGQAHTDRRLPASIWNSNPFGTDIDRRMPATIWPATVLTPRWMPATPSMNGRWYRPVGNPTATTHRVNSIVDRAHDHAAPTARSNGSSHYPTIAGDDRADHV